MAVFTLLLWSMVAFAVVVAASYVGTTLALRAYHDGESFSAREFLVRFDDDGK